MLDLLKEYDVIGDEGVLLDDFVDATYSYRKKAGWWPHEDWIGIFHHPVTIQSPWVTDRSFQVRCIGRSNEFKQARKRLIGAIGTTEELCTELREWLGVHVMCVKHPTRPTNVQWSERRFLAERRAFQVGFFLRNTQLALQLRPEVYKKWNVTRSTPSSRNPWMKKRDEQLSRHYRSTGKRRINRQHVYDLQRVDDDAYDELLATSVVINEVYGAAANNVVVECLTRATPIVINRLPAIEEYLGPHYPLYWRTLDEVSDILMDDARILAGHDYLRVHRAGCAWLQPEPFVRAMRDTLLYLTGA